MKTKQELELLLEDRKNLGLVAAELFTDMSSYRGHDFNGLVGGGFRCSHCEREYDNLNYEVLSCDKNPNTLPVNWDTAMRLRDKVVEKNRSLWKRCFRLVAKTINDAIPDGQLSDALLCYATSEDYIEAACRAKLEEMK